MIIFIFSFFCYRYYFFFTSPYSFLFLSFCFLFLHFNLDECEKFFKGGKKSKDGDTPGRFKKDLLLYKNLALNSEHRVLIIGTTNRPEDGDVKELRSFFDKFLYFPYPDYSSRRMMWKYFLGLVIQEGE